jgi:serine/threonine protein kinase/Tfp pilus assembly protein PilF
MIGTKLAHYEITSHLGTGGMGEVYQATDSKLGRSVAIKLLPEAFAHDQGRAARFEREARVLASLSHPNIAAIYGIEEVGGRKFLVMELVGGETLAERIQRGPLPIDESLAIAKQIAEGLESAHQKGTIHRDLKPANIKVTAQGQVKLLDFGLAKALAEDSAEGDPSNSPTIGAAETSAGMILGTAAYMSPEQAQGNSVDERSDIFSFGVVLYELISGRSPFAGNSIAEVLSAVLRDEPPPMKTPQPVDSVVRRCLAKRAADRFASMSELKAALYRLASKPAAEEKPSIAVLPFANMSGDKEQEYFSDGLAEEIINALVKVPGLRVIARTSAFAFKGQNIDIRKIAETLGVANILEGSVRRSGNRIRVTAQLITAADGSHLWSERYDRELADVFAVQDEISVAIAEALHTRLSPKVAAKPRYTPKLPAYEALLKAKHFHWKVTAESIDQARQFYEKAIALDPQYAMAHAAYGDYFSGRAVLGMTPAREAIPAARALAQRALELDSSVPEAHMILCFGAAIYDYNWKEATRRLTLAAADGTVSSWCHMVCGWSYYLALGRRNEAVQELELAVLGDPLHLTYRTVLAMCLGAVGRYAEAEEHLRQVQDLDPNYFWANTFFADLYAARRMFVEALPFAERAYSLAPWHMPTAGVYAGALARTGRLEEANEVLQSLGSGVSYGASTALAIYHLCCGEIDLAVDWFEKAIAERYPFVVAFLQGAIGEPLRASPRWPRLAAMMNLPAE